MAHGKVSPSGAGPRAKPLSKFLLIALTGLATGAAWVWSRHRQRDKQSAVIGSLNSVEEKPEASQLPNPVGFQEVTSVFAAPNSSSSPKISQHSVVVLAVLAKAPQLFMLEDSRWLFLSRVRPFAVFSGLMAVSAFIVVQFDSVGGEFRV